MPTEPKTFELGPFELSRGRHVVSLVSEEPSVMPDQFLFNGDRRRITVALRDWSFVVDE